MKTYIKTFVHVHNPLVMKRALLILFLIFASSNLKAQYHLLYFSDDTIATLKSEANHLFLQGKCQESIKYYKRLALIDSLKKSSAYNIALNFSNLKEPDSARYYFDKALELGYDSIEIFNELVILYKIELKNYEKAYNLISEMIVYWPDNAQMYINRADIWYRWKNESSGYMKDMKKAAELGDKEAKDFVENYEKKREIMRKKLKEGGLN